MCPLPSIAPNPPPRRRLAGALAACIVLACHLGAQAQSADPGAVLPWGASDMLWRVGSGSGPVTTHSLRLTAEPTPQRLALDHFERRGSPTRFGVEWQRNQKSRFGLDKGSRSLGLQLDADYRMSLKLRRNGVMLSLRGQF